MNKLIGLLLILICQVAIAQTEKQTVDLNRTQFKIEGVPFYLKMVTCDAEVKQVIGDATVNEKNKIVTLEFPTEKENHILGFIQKAFNSQKAGTPIALHIKQMGIYPTFEGKSSASDTFKYQCEFKANFNGQWESLYTFNAKNAIGQFENPTNVIENYMARAVTTSIQKFSNAFEKNKDWNILIKSNSGTVNVIVKHNKFKTTLDSLACEKNGKLSESFYKVMDKNLEPIGHSRFILTYKAEASEKNNAIKLNIETFAFFDKNRSWISKNSFNKNAWIAQQQGHYDLCTLYGLKLNKAMNEFPYSMGEYKSEMNTIYNDLYKEYTKIRKEYDDETKSNPATLAKWQQKIAAMFKQVL